MLRYPALHGYKQLSCRACAGLCRLVQLDITHCDSANEPRPAPAGP